MVVLDKEGMYEGIEKFSDQIVGGWELAEDVRVDDSISNIIIAGVGDAIISGHIIKQYLKDYKLQVFVAEDFKIPSFANKDSLVFIVSYKDHAEETVSMYRDALKKGCHTITIEDGSKLKELCTLSSTQHLLLPKDLHKRLSYGYLFFSMLKILQNSKLVEEQEDYLKRTMRVLKHNKFEELTTDLVEKINNKIPLVYSSPHLEAVALKWKTSFNNTTKIPSFYSVFPSLSYNEISGFYKQEDNFYVIILKSDNEDQKIKKRITKTKELIRNQGVPVTEMAITGDCYLTKIFSALIIGDWISYALAIKRGVDPTPTPAVDELKEVT